MNRIRCHARRLAGLLAGLAGTLLALSASAPAAFAISLQTPDRGGGPRATIASKPSAPAGVHTQAPACPARLPASLRWPHGSRG